MLAPKVFLAYALTPILVGWVLAWIGLPLAPGAIVSGTIGWARDEDIYCASAPAKAVQYPPGWNLVSGPGA